MSRSAGPGTPSPREFRELEVAPRGLGRVSPIYSVARARRFQMLYERSGDCDGQVIYSCKGRRDLMRAVPARAKSKLFPGGVYCEAADSLAASSCSSRRIVARSHPFMTSSSPCWSAPPSGWARPPSLKPLPCLGKPLSSTIHPQACILANPPVPEHVSSGAFGCNTIDQTK